MSNIPCPFPCNPCLDPDSPFLGFSSETTDSRTFLCADYGPGQMVPPLDSCWQQRNFVSFTSSQISEVAACDLADTLVREAAAVAWCQTQFSNSPQTCPVFCADGSEFFYTVAPGTFFANNQDAANALAMQFACEQAPINSICIGLLSQHECCIGQPFSAVILATSNNAPLTFQIASGQLPPGLVITANSPESAIITGTPTVGGQYQFIVEAFDTLGNFSQRQLSIEVLALANGSVLPQGFIGVPYSVQLSITGSTQNAPVWQIIGSLPTGLNLNIITGVISGTPTVGATSNFAVQFSDGVISCSQPVSINVKVADFTTGLVAWYKLNEYPPGTPAGSTMAKDSSGNGNDIGSGFSSLSQTWVSGFLGSALQFVGTVNGKVARQEISLTMTGLPTGTQPFSLTMWMRRTTLTPTNDLAAIFGFGDNSGPGSRAEFFTNTGGNIGLETSGGYVEVAMPADTNWHHYAISWPGGAISLTNAVIYVDGVSQSTTVTANISTNLPGPGDREITIAGIPGVNPTSASNLPDMAIGDARIYNLALTAQEVSAIFNNPA